MRLNTLSFIVLRYLEREFKRVRWTKCERQRFLCERETVKNVKSCYIGCNGDTYSSARNWAAAEDVIVNRGFWIDNEAA